MASATILLFQAGLLLSIALIAWRPALASVLMPVYGIVLAVFMGIMTVGNPSDDLTLPVIEKEDGEADVALNAQECKQILDLTDEISVFGPIENDRVIARRQLWEQFPEQVQGAIATCLAQSRNNGTAVDIVVE